MAEKRERLDVVNDMLKAILRSNNKIGPTKLIHLSNLSPVMFKEYIKDLTENDLIKERLEKSKKYYEVTDKGFKFLEQYKSFRNFVEELGL